MDIKLKNQETLSIIVLGEDSGFFKIIGYINKTQVGYLIVAIAKENLYAIDAQVELKYRRMGIATKLYNFAEKLTKKKIYPYEYLNYDAKSSNDAVEFWRSRGLILSNGDKIFDC